MVTTGWIMLWPHFLLTLAIFGILVFLWREMSQAKRQTVWLLIEIRDLLAQPPPRRAKE